MDRRFFLKSGGMALAGIGLTAALPAPLQAMARAAAPVAGTGRVLVVLFQRGAVDGLNMVVPHGDSAYYAARPSIAVPRPGQDGGALDLDGHFGLHPRLAPLMPLWRERRLAIVDAVGSPDATRSHFDAQDYMESATPGIKSTHDGWLNRVLQSRLAAGAGSPFAAVAVTAQLPRSLAGPAPALAMTDLAQFAVEAGRLTAQVEGGFESLWRQQAEGDLGASGRETFEAVQFLQRSGAAQRLPENGARYPESPLGRSLRQLAQLIKAEVGLQLGFVEAGGWDTHVNQGGATGQLANGLRDLGDSLAAFFTDLGRRGDDVLLVTQSEFGRTVRENGSHGTDHGHGNVMLVLGGDVRGGQVLGSWPGLSDPGLYDGRDLAVTTDFRDVLAEIVQRHLRDDRVNQVFPGYAIDSARFRGVLRA